MPSGNVICYVMQLLPAQKRAEFCNYLGGHLLELQTMEDYNAFVYYLWKLITFNGRSNSTIMATGAATGLINNSATILLWQDSKELVDFSLYGMIRPTGSVIPTLLPGQFMFLKPFSYTNSFRPNFTLHGVLSNDANAEFICMKPGEI